MPVSRTRTCTCTITLHDAVMYVCAFPSGENIDIGGSALLAFALGIRPSKDNFVRLDLLYAEYSTTLPLVLYTSLCAY